MYREYGCTMFNEGSLGTIRYISGLDPSRIRILRIAQIRTVTWDNADNKRYCMDKTAWQSSLCIHLHSSVGRRWVSRFPLPFTSFQRPVMGRQTFFSMICNFSWLCIHTKHSRLDVRGVYVPIRLLLVLRVSPNFSNGWTLSSPHE